MQTPDHVPPRGFYYHYKHDPAGPINGYAYELVSVGLDTEHEGVYYVNYLPLYEDAPAYRASQRLGAVCVYSRPLEMVNT